MVATAEAGAIEGMRRPRAENALGWSLIDFRFLVLLHECVDAPLSERLNDDEGQPEHAHDEEERAQPDEVGLVGFVAMETEENSCGEDYDHDESVPDVHGSGAADQEADEGSAGANEDDEARNADVASSRVVVPDLLLGLLVEQCEQRRCLMGIERHEDDGCDDHADEEAVEHILGFPNWSWETD